MECLLVLLYYYNVLAYWGREGASAAQAQAQAQAALFGFGSRYPPPTTLGVAANQAASLSLHPAASEYLKQLYIFRIYFAYFFHFSPIFPVMWGRSARQSYVK